MSKLDQFSRAYDDDFAYALDNDLIMNWYPKRITDRASGKSLLELGVGHGTSSVIFEKKFDKHVIIDGSKAIIEKFSRINPGFKSEIVFSMFEDFTPQEKFDNIVMGFVLEHVVDPEKLVDKYKKFLKADGRLFVTVPNAEALNKRIGKEAGLIQDLFELGEGDRALGHTQLFSVGTLRDLLQSAGLEVVDVEGLFLKPLATHQLQELKLEKSILDGMMVVGVKYPELSVGLLAEAKLKQ